MELINQPERPTPLHSCNGCGTIHPGSVCRGEHLDERPPTQAELMAALEGIVRERQVLDHDEQVIVDELRSMKTPWSQVARCLGISKSAAHRQFGGDE